jgi:hypothetical protein
LGGPLTCLEFFAVADPAFLQQTFLSISSLQPSLAKNVHNFIDFFLIFKRKSPGIRFPGKLWIDLMTSAAILLIAEAEIKNPSFRFRNGVSLIHYSIILPSYWYGKTGR